MLDDGIEVRFGAAAGPASIKLVRLQTALDDSNRRSSTATELIDVSTDDVIIR